MTHLELQPKLDVASFRKIAIGTWQTAYDPTVYGTLSVRMDKAMEYVEEFRRRTGRRLTVTHMLTKAVAEALRRCPDANAILRFNRIHLRQSIVISLLVVQPDEREGKVDLTAARVEHAERKSLLELVDEVDGIIRTVRERKDRALEKGKGTVDKIPFIFMNAFLKLLSFLMYTLNLDLSALGMPRDPFGAVTITNVGSLGLETAYVPLVPYTRVPIFIAPGAVRDIPVVDGGKVVPGKVMNVNASFDHRFIDGYHAAVLSRTVREMLESPFDHFDDLSKLGDRAPAPMAAIASDKLDVTI